MQHLLVGVTITILRSHNVIDCPPTLLIPLYFLVLVLQAFNQLEIATHIEMVASLLRRDAIRLIKTVLAGTAMAQFTDVIEGVFGEEEPASVCEAFKEAPPKDTAEEEEEDEEPVGVCASSSKTVKRKQPSASSSSSKCKVAHPTCGGMCSLDSAEVYYSRSSDEGNHLHAGVDSHFISSRKSSTHTAAARYSCLFSQIMKADGKIVPDCDIISTTMGQLSTHICQFHLGVAVGCYICGKRWWSAATWMEHMKKTHPILGTDAYYVKEGMDIASFEVKHEVPAEDI